MSFRQTVIGKEGGQTLWEKIKKDWKSTKDQGKIKQTLTNSYNPLRVKIKDIVEIGLLEKKQYEVDSIIVYRTPENDPDYIRYGLKDLVSKKSMILEALPGDDGEPSFSDFTVVDEFDLDNDLIYVMEEESHLQHTRITDQGESEVIDFEKDFISEASAIIMFAEQFSEFPVVTYNYFREQPDGKESYLCVEVSQDNQWMTFYEGRKMQAASVSAIGTL